MTKTRILGLLLCVAVLAGCYGNAQPHVDQGQGCAPVKVLLAGDSLMAQSQQAIIDTLHADGYPVEVRSIAHAGSNVIEYGTFSTGSEYPNPRDELAAAIADFQPDIVLVNWGINVPWWLSGVDWGYAAWATQVAMQQVRDIAGSKLYWATIPPRGDGDAGWAYNTNEWVHQLGVPLVDWRAAVTSEFDTYETFLEYREDDSVHPVRTDDGLHLTADGVTRVARWTAARLAPVVCGAS